MSQAYITLLWLFVFFLPLHQKTSIKILIPLALVSIIIARGNLLKKQLLFQFRYPLLLLLIMILGISYSSNLKEGLAILSNKGFIIPVSFIIAVAGIGIVKIDKVLIIFSAGTITASLVCLIYAVYRDYSQDAYWAYYHLVFTNPINSHPIYMGYFVNFTIVIIYYYFIEGHIQVDFRLRKWLGVLLISFLILIHVFLADRIPLFALILSLTIWFLFHSRSRVRVMVYFGLIAISISLIVFLLKDRTLIFDRFNDLLISQESVGDTKYGGYIERLRLWEAGVKANDNMLFGVGTGDGTDALLLYYERNNFDYSYVSEEYNSHNQAIQVYLSYGLLGVMSYLIMTVFPLFKSFRKKTIIEFMFYAPFVIYGLTEVYLGRYQGLGFYFFFYAFFVFNAKENNNE